MNRFFGLSSLSFVIVQYFFRQTKFHQTWKAFFVHFIEILTSFGCKKKTIFYNPTKMNFVKSNIERFLYQLHNMYILITYWRKKNIWKLPSPLPFPFCIAPSVWPCKYIFTNPSILVSSNHVFVYTCNLITEKKKNWKIEKNV